MRKKNIVWIAAGIVLVGAAAWGPVVSNVEQPKYETVEAADNIEIRDYAPMIVAETDVSGERRTAIGQGFRTIADYIFGNNLSSQKISMTAPVTQQPGENMAMTAPVTEQRDGNTLQTLPTWQVSFVMPADYTMGTLPKPKNPAVKIKEIAAKRLAVIRFSGWAGEDSLKRRTDELDAFIKAKNLHPLSPPTYAYYNPPWTLPFFRRNEVMIEIARQ
jgi:DNA gyrase inhibitor GyrI